MNQSSRIILVVLPLAALAVAFWLLVLAPKRDRASELEAEVASLQAQVEDQNELAAAAEAAREDFPRAYRRLVVLGKATPGDDDTSSLLVQLEKVAADARVDFVSLEAVAGEGGSVPAPSESPSEPSATAVPGEPSEEPPAADAATASATEATAALLPIGASIGPAGLPVMKYSLTFRGDFFHLADYVDGLDDLVTTRADGGLGVKGRLITIDGFELVADEEEIGPNPTLDAEFSITTFLTPADQGPTGGASPSGPAPVTEPQPVSTPAPAPESATASATTP